MLATARPAAPAIAKSRERPAAAGVSAGVIAAYFKVVMSSSSRGARRCRGASGHAGRVLLYRFPIHPPFELCDSIGGRYAGLRCADGAGRGRGGGKPGRSGPAAADLAHGGHAPPL